MVVVNHLHVVGVSARPAEDDSPLIIDPHRMKAPPVALQPFETIAGWAREIAKLGRIVQVQQLPTGGTTETGRKSPGLRRRSVHEKILGQPISKVSIT
jgi:hypothetical protein